MFNKLRTRIKLYQLRSYIRKKLAYHEAGHLIYSYLLRIPCNSIAVNFDFVSDIEFQNGCAIVAMESKSQVEHLLPLDLQRALDRATLGITNVSVELRIPVREMQRLFNTYFVILLAGRLSEEFFAKEFGNDQMDYLQKTYSKDLMERNLNEDVERFNYLNTALYSTIPERKNTFEVSRAFVTRYLKQPAIAQAILMIAKKIKGNKKLYKTEIEELLLKVDYLNYCKVEYLEAIKNL